MKYAKAFGVVAAILLVLLVITAPFSHPLRKTPADKIALSYGGGLFEGAQYQKTVQPGSGLVNNGLFDKWYQYPVTQRDVTIAADETEESKDYGMPDSITARTSDGVACTVQLTVTFKLNTNQIRSFHETIGLKFKAWDDDGWGKMLAKNVLPPIENSVNEQCRLYTSDDIAKNPDVISAVSAGIGKDLKSTVNGLLGDDNYFCGPEFKVGEPECPDFQVLVKTITLPDGVNASLEGQVTAANEIVTAQSNAAVKQEQAKGEKAAKDAVAEALTPEYLEYLRAQALKTCAGNGNCTIVVAPDGTGVNINTGG